MEQVDSKGMLGQEASGAPNVACREKPRVEEQDFARRMFKEGMVKLEGLQAGALMRLEMRFGSSSALAAFYQGSRAESARGEATAHGGGKGNDGVGCVA